MHQHHIQSTLLLLFGGGYANNAHTNTNNAHANNEHTINITPYVVEAWYNVNIKLKEYSCGQKFT